MTKPFRFALSVVAALTLAACEKAPAPSAAPAISPPADSPPAPVTVAPPTSAPAAPSAAAPAANPGPAVHAGEIAPPPLVYQAPAGAAKAAAKANTRVANFAGLEADIPLSWAPTPPANSMRLAEFQAPVAGQAPAEAVVFYFPPGQGGPQDMNIARWASQFTDSKGEPVKPLVSKTIINNMAVTRVELSGNYSRGVGMGATEGAAKPNQVLLAAIITTPTQSNVTFHFFGTQASVKKQKDSFEAVLKSIRFKG